MGSRGNASETEQKSRQGIMGLRARAYWISEEAAWDNAPAATGDIWRHYRSRNLQEIGDYVAKHLPKGFRAALRFADSKGEKVQLQLNSTEKGRVRIGIMFVSGGDGLLVNVAWEEELRSKKFRATLASKSVSKWVNDSLELE